MVALKEFANFITMNVASLAPTYAQLLAETNAAFAEIPLSQRSASARKLLKAVIDACTGQQPDPVLSAFASTSARWGANVPLIDPLTEVECLGQTLTPVVTNLEAGKFLWATLFAARQAVSAATVPPAPLPAPAQPTPDAAAGDTLPPSQEPLIRALINNLPDQIYMKDAQSRFLLVNDAVRRHLGAASLESVVGKTDFDFSPPELARQYFAEEQQLFKSGQSLIGHEQQIYDHETNTNLWVSSTKVLFKDNQGQIAGLVGLNRDITSAKLSEAKMARQATELQTVAEVSSSISTILDTDQLLHSVVNLTKERFGLYHAHVYLLDALQNTLVLTAGAGEVGQKLLAQGWTIPLEKEASLVATAARRGEPLISNDVTLSPDYFQNPLLPDTRAEMAVPMIAGSQLLGVLDVQAAQPGYFDADAERIYASLAAQIAVAVRNAGLYQQTQNTLNETEVLYLASSALNTAQSYNDILAVLRTHTILGQNAQNVSLNYFDAPWSTLQKPEFIEVLARWTQLPQDAVSSKYQLAAFPSAETLLKPDAPVIIEDVASNTLLDENARALYAHQFKAKSTIFVPLVVGGQWVGFINAVYQQPTTFPDKAVRRLMALSTQATVAIQSIKRLVQSQQQARREQLLREISIIINSGESLLDGLPQATEQIQQLVPFQVLTLATYTPGAPEFVLYGVGAAGAQGQHFGRQGLRLPINGTCPGWVITHNKVWRDENLRQTARFAEDEQLIAEGVLSRLVIPLRIGEQVIGTVNLASNQQAAFTREHLLLMWQVADQLASALERSRLLDETQRRARREQSIREITDKMRGATSIEQLVQVAVEELGQRLAVSHAELQLKVYDDAAPDDLPPVNGGFRS